MDSYESFSQLRIFCEVIKIKQNFILIVGFENVINFRFETMELNHFVFQFIMKLTESIMYTVHEREPQEKKLSTFFVVS